MNEKEQISFNVKAHDKVASRYEEIHGEIYNPTEQRRLREKLALASSWIRPTTLPTALDFGCGAGNLTRHLVELGFRVTASDVSKEFLSLIEEKFPPPSPVTTFALNGDDLAGLRDGGMDLAATYSVLHHVPDYLAAVREMARVVKPGGVLYLDHEVNESYWNPNPIYREFTRLARPADPRRYFRPSTYYQKIQAKLFPRYREEGDIHVFPDDHIEWDKIERLLRDLGFEIMLREDYLLNRRDCPPAVYESFKTRCNDMRLLISRKL